MNDVNKSLINSIHTISRRSTDNAGYDKTYNAVVVRQGTSKGYKISMNGIIYDNIPLYGTINLPLGTRVKVLVPQGNMNQMFILCPVT